MAKVLLTGGAGYIGSHTYLALVDAGFEVVILDNFSNARVDVPDRLARITGEFVTALTVDVMDKVALAEVLATHNVDAVIHFAAFKAVGESVQKPLSYFQNNLTGLLNLLEAMEAAGVRTFVYSSSATVYGDATIVPTPETAPRAPTSPYALTKVVGEQVLEALQASDSRWNIGILRYFNPVGAHSSALIGEDPADIPNNLMPYVAKVATGELAEIGVFGDDYETPDGTGVRDYIHVEDLAHGHVLSVQALLDGGRSHTLNLGTGTGYSVLDLISAYGRACGRDLPYRILPRRSGDVTIYLSDPSKAEAELGFRATRTLDDMCRSSWAWVSGQLSNDPKP
jgi:UDP-glucose 4-epimerase